MNGTRGRTGEKQRGAGQGPLRTTSMVPRRGTRAGGHRRASAAPACPLVALAPSGRTSTGKTSVTHCSEYYMYTYTVLLASVHYNNCVYMYMYMYMPDVHVYMCTCTRVKGPAG